MNESFNYNTALLFIGMRRGKMTAQTGVSLFVELKTKAGKEDEVASYLAGAEALALATLMPRGTE